MSGSGTESGFGNKSGFGTEKVERLKKDTPIYYKMHCKYN